MDKGLNSQSLELEADVKARIIWSQLIREDLDFLGDLMAYTSGGIKGFNILEKKTTFRKIYIAALLFVFCRLTFRNFAFRAFIFRDFVFRGFTKVVLYTTF